jgi:hypothetical protein
MRVTGIPAQVRLSYEIAGLAAQQKQHMSMLEELLGSATWPLSEVVSEEIKAQLVEESADLRRI